MNNETFIEALRAVYTRPAMYGVVNVDQLSSFIEGYLCGLNQVDRENAAQLLGEFGSFVHQELGTRETRSWSKAIEFCSSSDLHSVELFGRLL